MLMFLVFHPFLSIHNPFFFFSICSSCTKKMERNFYIDFFIQALCSLSHISFVAQLDAKFYNFHAFHFFIVFTPALLNNYAFVEQILHVFQELS